MDHRKPRPPVLRVQPTKVRPLDRTTRPRPVMGNVCPRLETETTTTRDPRGTRARAVRPRPATNSRMAPCSPSTEQRSCSTA
jgi:hypothetical protein